MKDGELRHSGTASGFASCVIAEQTDTVVRAVGGSAGRKEEQHLSKLHFRLPMSLRRHTVKRFLMSNKLNFICCSFLTTCKLSTSNMRCLSSPPKEPCSEWTEGIFWVFSNSPLSHNHHGIAAESRCETGATVQVHQLVGVDSLHISFWTSRTAWHPSIQPGIVGSQGATPTLNNDLRVVVSQILK